MSSQYDEFTEHRMAKRAIRPEHPAAAAIVERRLTERSLDRCQEIASAVMAALPIGEKRSFILAEIGLLTADIGTLIGIEK